MRKALISVSDKTGVVDFAKALVNCGFEIISTGGTLHHLQENNVACVGIETYTQFPEILEGRVKTLHPKVHGGLLSKRDNALHQQHVLENEIEYIDVVCVNLYPFEETLKKAGVSHEEIIENIDIGGPSMLRSAAKNFDFVTVVTDVADYERVIEEFKTDGNTTLATRQYLAAKVFNKTAAYDTAIANYFNRVTEYTPDKLLLSYTLNDVLPYGENPHQTAEYYTQDSDVSYALQNAKQLHGKKMSYNNLQDASAALDILQEFDETVCVVLKHMNPCGVSLGKSVYDAFMGAYQADPVSIFGGIVAINGKVDVETAKEMNKIFLEIILAEEFDEEALAILQTKKNLRIYQIPQKTDVHERNIKSVRGGVLVQDANYTLYDELQTVTTKQPTQQQIDDMIFGYKIVKHVKSNAIVLVKDGQTIGVGAGQMNRVGSCHIAFEQAKEKAIGAVLASDAFFPMRDSVDLAAQYQISAIIQPGGSIKDQDSIDACNEHDMAMVFAKLRHFKH